MARYTSLSLVGDRLGTEFTSSSSPTDQEVNKIIDDVEALIDSYAGRRFDAYTKSNEYYDHDGSDFITTTEPLVSVVSLEKTTDGGDTWVSVPSTDYVVYPEFNRIEKRVGGSSNTGAFPNISGQRVVRITYKAGYSTVPQDIVALATDMAVLEVMKLIINTQVFESGGDIQVGPIRISESVLLNSPGYIKELQDRVESRLSALQQGRFWTTSSKRW